MNEERNLRDEGQSWYYSEKGQRLGPKTVGEMVDLIQKGALDAQTLVWTAGFTDWQELSQTVLSTNLNRSVPPPLSGRAVNNSIVWVLAFAPIIGAFIEYYLVMARHGETIEAAVALAENKYWAVTLFLNILLCWLDERQLKKAGWDTGKFKGWVWLVPVYMFQRAKTLMQSMAYVLVWWGSFLVSIFLL
jgi:hypothetical protein